MNPESFIYEKAKMAVEALYSAEVNEKMIQTQATRKEFEGDITLVTFPLLKTSRKSPEVTAQEIGAWLKENCPEVEAFNVIKGFLNIKFSEWFWQGIFGDMYSAEDFGQLPATGKTDFCSPTVPRAKQSPSLSPTVQLPPPSPFPTPAVSVAFTCSYCDGLISFS